MDMIKDLLQNFIESDLYAKANADIKMEFLDYFEKKLSNEDYQKLEQEIADYSLQLDKKMFESGFIYAWDLFHQCHEEYQLKK